MAKKTTKQIKKRTVVKKQKGKVKKIKLKKSKIKTKEVVKAKKQKQIGKITHYFSDIKVAVINLLSPLKQGDKIRIIGGESTDFEQKVESMQIDHEKVKSAKKGSDLGIKVDEKVHEGYKVFKV